MEDVIWRLVEPSMVDLGFDLVDVKIRKNPALKNKQLNKLFIIDVVLERQDGDNFTLSDCGMASKHISVLLDNTDMIAEKYYLHVSSAGVERPLVKLPDYKRFIGRDVKISLKKATDSLKEYKGKIADVIEDNILIINEKGEVSIDFYSIKKANLLITDETFKKIINKTLS